MPGAQSASPEVSKVTATADGIEGTSTVTFVPVGYTSQNWATSGDFAVTQMTLLLNQYLSALIYAYNGCIDLLLCPGTTINPNLLPAANIYLLTPVGMSAASGGNQVQFASGLRTYFGISPCSSAVQSNRNYNPVATVIIEVPLAQVANVLFNSNIQAPLGPLCLPISTAFSPNPCITTTASGYVDLAFTISQNVDNAQTAVDLLEVFGKMVATAVKATTGTTTGSLFSLTSVLSTLLQLGDLSVTVITTDLTESGPLNSDTFFDLAQLSSAVGTLSGYEAKRLDILEASCDLFALAGVALATSPTGVGAVAGSASAGFQLVKIVATSIDIGIEAIPATLDPALQNNAIYQDIEYGFNAFTEFIDPAGTTIKPSFFDQNGNLVLGYDPTTGVMSYAGPDSILIPAGDGYLAFLAENPNSPSDYTETLNAVGGTGTPAVPYGVRFLSYNRAQALQRYEGMLMAGTNVSIPARFNATDGSFVSQTFLEPTVTVQQNSGSYTIAAKALLNNGTSVAATNAYMIVDGQESTMTQVDASTFDTTINTTFTIPTPFTIFVISPTIPGGFASGILGPSSLAPTITFSPAAVAF
jgi:hypothetical protein